MHRLTRKNPFHPISLQTVVLEGEEGYMEREGKGERMEGRKKRRQMSGRRERVKERG